MYAISDLIDEFEADTEEISQPSAKKFSLKKFLDIMIPCLKFGPKIIVANKMEKMREDLEVITDQHRKFKLVEGTNTSEPKVTDIRETSSKLETHIVGRAEDNDEILSSLYGAMTEAITILPIYGIGGLGKTTLAKMVYNSSQFKQYSQVWVYVSQTFDLMKIGNSIISQLSEKEEQSKYTEMQMIHNSLQKLLADKKILIVLDDLWEGEDFHLESLMDMLRVGKGSNVVVIVTTRYESIANKISTTEPYKLAPLSDDMCWSIIKQKSAFESRGHKEQLEKIGKVIAMKCGGVALAAKSLGHMLKSMKPSEWESVRDNNIWTVSSSIDTPYSQVLASLKLSYSVIPSYLKLCFSYCAIFPKGHKIFKDDLISQWVSLGFSTRQLGERYISQLLGLSFLEHSKSPSTIELHVEDITFLTMHDLLHDLARSVMGDEILLVGEGGDAKGSYYHYALLDDCSKPLGSELSKIRALRFIKCHTIKLCDAAFSSAKSMRVLDLGQCSIDKLPDSICVLKQLRYLNAPRIQHTTIPDSITRLSKLIYLNLHGSRAMLALPESIGNIEGLVYFNLSGCSGIKQLPESFGRLKELTHLDCSNCSYVEGISENLGRFRQLKYLNLSYCKNIGELPEALGGLSKLQYLNLSFSSYLRHCTEVDFLGALTKLEYLNLSSEHCGLRKLPEALCQFIQLKYLNLAGCSDLTKLPRLFGSLKSLVDLDLSHCHRVDNLHEALSGLNNLQYLNLQCTTCSVLPDDLSKLMYLNVSDLRFSYKYNEEGCHIDHISNTLTSIQHLDLSRNCNIISIPESICNLRNLHTLDLSECRRIKNIPESMGTIDSLKYLNVNGCWSLSNLPQLSSSAVCLPHFVVQPGYSDSGSNLVQLQYTDPVQLEISKLENVKSVAEGHCIKLMEKKSLVKLSLKWTRAVKRFVDDKILLEKLVPPSTLKKLEICGYNGVSFPSWVVGQLLNLESLVLRDMANLEEWSTSYSSGEEHVIDTLEIHDCPLFRMKPLALKAKSWIISKSDNVLSSWEEEGTMSHISWKLDVAYYKVPMHQWRFLQQFPGLTYLVLNNCSDLTSSPEITRHLSYVKTLRLENMEELPVWMGIPVQVIHTVYIVMTSVNLQE
ncbi:unnamed protein product [Alopecurus aequalis]